MRRRRASENDLAPLRFLEALLCTIVGPDFSYSALEIHICWAVLEDEIMAAEPQRALPLGGRHDFNFIVDGVRAVSSLLMR